MYYQITITKTAKYGRQEWSTYDMETKEFLTKKEVDTFLNDRYFNIKTKYPMFRGEGQRVGTIFAFKDKDYDTGKKFYCQDWIEIQLRKAEPLGFYIA